MIYDVVRSYYKHGIFLTCPTLSGQNSFVTQSVRIKTKVKQKLLFLFYKDLIFKIEIIGHGDQEELRAINKLIWTCHDWDFSVIMIFLDKHIIRNLQSTQGRVTANQPIVNCPRAML